MRIDVWSDVICPWCWLGHARLEKALGEAGAKTGTTFDVVFRSFELDAKTDPALDIPTNEMLRKKLNLGEAQIDAMHARLAGLGKADGLDYHFDKARTSNTFDAHQLIHLAKEHGKQGDVVRRLFAANFRDGIRIGDRDALVKIATEAGLDEKEAADALETQRFAAAVRADEADARKHNVSGVPYFLFNGKVAVSGAESVDILVRAVQKAA